MILTLQSAPAEEPVTVTEAKLHCRADSVEENSLIEGLIRACRQHAESVTGRALVSQTWVMNLPRFPGANKVHSWLPVSLLAQALEIPKPPLQSVTSIKYLDEAGTQQTWASTNYTVMAPSGDFAERGLVFPKVGVAYPVTYPSPEAVEVVFVAGYGTRAAVPAGLKAAMLLRIGELYRQREIGAVGTVYTVTDSERSMLWPYRSMRAA